MQFLATTKTSKPLKNRILIVLYEFTEPKSVAFFLGKIYKFKNVLNPIVNAEQSDIKPYSGGK